MPFGYDKGIGKKDQEGINRARISILTKNSIAFFSAEFNIQKIAREIRAIFSLPVTVIGRAIGKRGRLYPSHDLFHMDPLDFSQLFQKGFCLFMNKF